MDDSNALTCADPRNAAGAPTPRAIAPDLDALETPYLLLDRQRLRQNARRMAERAKLLGVALRPHVKTIKSVEALQDCLPGTRAITVSTLREAGHFFAAGYRDIIYAVGITAAKLPHVARLRRDGAELHVIVDQLAVARQLAAFDAGEAGLSVFIEIDCGGARGGVRPDSEALLAIARALAGPRLSLRGVLTHAGQSYRAAHRDEVRAVAEEERRAAVTAAERLRAHGFTAPAVSVGSTPTALTADHLAGVTEMRPGVFFLMDLFQAGLGVCTVADVALTVIASVVGLRPEDGTVLIDAGALALSQDRSTASQLTDVGFGAVGDLAGPPWPGARVAAVHQEHGFVSVPDAALLARLRVGDRVRVWPNHACMTAAGHARYVVRDADGAIAGTWARVNHW